MSTCRIDFCFGTGENPLHIPQSSSVWSSTQSLRETSRPWRNSKHEPGGRYGGSAFQLGAAQLGVKGKETGHESICEGSKKSRCTNVANHPLFTLTSLRCFNHSCKEGQKLLFSKTAHRSSFGLVLRFFFDDHQPTSSLSLSLSMAGAEEPKDGRLGSGLCQCLQQASRRRCRHSSHTWSNSVRCVGIKVL